MSKKRVEGVLMAKHRHRMRLRSNMPKCMLATRRPTLVRSSFDSEGCLRTGDLCYIDRDGFLFVVDRLKELIQYKGYQVHGLTWWQHRRNTQGWHLLRGDSVVQLRNSRRVVQDPQGGRLGVAGEEARNPCCPCCCFLDCAKRPSTRSASARRFPCSS